MSIAKHIGFFARSKYTLGAMVHLIRRCINHSLGSICDCDQHKFNNNGGFHQARTCID